MEGFLVSAATGALKAVVVKLATLLGDEFKHMKDVRQEIEPLSKELNWMHAFIEKMSEDESPSDQDKVWMTDVREMSYDIEDNLNYFMICFHDDKDAKPKGLIKKCRKLLTKMKAHRHISKVIQDFKAQVRTVGDRNQRYRTGVMSNRNTHEVVDSRALVIFKEASDLVGIDGPKNEIIDLLTKDKSSQQEVKVVAIVGLGGLGKTTLAKKVYDSLKDKFDCQSFVTVSRNPNMVKVLRNILYDIDVKKYRDIEDGDVPHLITEISNSLRDKSYAIEQIIR